MWQRPCLHNARLVRANGSRCCAASMVTRARAARRVLRTRYVFPRLQQSLDAASRPILVVTAHLSSMI